MHVSSRRKKIEENLRLETRTMYKESNSEKRNILTKLKYKTKMTVYFK